MKTGADTQEALIQGIVGHPNLVAGVASTYAERVRGLMQSEPRNLLIVFPAQQRVCLHMYLVHFEITAVLLDDSFRVLEISRLKPNEARCFKARARYVLELAGKYSVAVGSQLTVTWPATSAPR